ncbi:hypothetical protein C7271_03030 [filamentous cyanobacterium CCP5]|nr:hypothetical protein C7271_03030 [filamentous cyanobacterium CCP5]
MKRSGLVLLISLPLVLLGLGPLNPARRTESAAFNGSDQQPTTLEGLANSGSWLRVVESLVSLSTVQRNLVSAARAGGSPEEEAPALSPDAELLLAQVTTTGLGPIKVGMTVEEIRQAGVDLISSKAAPEGSNCHYYRVKNLVESIDFMAVDDRIIRIDVGPGSFAETLSGAKIGTSEAEIYQLYGDRIETVETPMGKQLVFTPTTPGEDLYRLVFALDANGTVVQYRAGQFPAVTWPEGCG